MNVDFEVQSKVLLHIEIVIFLGDFSWNSCLTLWLMPLSKKLFVLPVELCWQKTYHILCAAAFQICLWLLSYRSFLVASGNRKESDQPASSHRMAWVFPVSIYNLLALRNWRSKTEDCSVCPEVQADMKTQAHGLRFFFMPIMFTINEWSVLQYSYRSSCFIQTLSSEAIKKDI